MCQKTFHYEQLIRIIAATDKRGFIQGFRDYLSVLNIDDYIIWTVSNNLAEPVYSAKRDADFNPDIYDLGINEPLLGKELIQYEFFDEVLPIYQAFFLTHKNITTYAVTIHDDISSADFSTMEEQLSAISFRAYELTAKEKQTDIYVDYQKKIDFVKKGSIIFSSIDTDTLINTAQQFFMEAFSAEAAGVLYNQQFQGLGFDVDDLKKEISINGMSAWDYLCKVRGTEFVDEYCSSTKYGIKNVFMVYDERHEFLFILFNIHVDFVPDKEFSELISSILSIALENAKNHEKQVELKLEESEMDKTVDILNKFVPGEIHQTGDVDIFGVSYPAKKTGGDYFNIVRTDDKLLICVADVCGKGYDAAVVTVVLSVINEFSNMGKINGSLVDVEQSLNEFIISKNLDGRFVTAFFGIYDFGAGELEYLSLGHEPTVVLREDGMETLEAEFLPVGIMAEEYKTEKVQIGSGDTLFIYTDGIIEYIDYPELYICLSDRKDQSSETFVRGLYQELVPDRDTQKDDFTCVMLKFNDMTS